MHDLRSKIPAIVKARRTTLISGPTGTGKEVLAWTLHQQAFGETHPYVPVHCGALPENLIEAELFGHTKGAFTGATHARDGLIKSAIGGTLFLDEIDSLNKSLQVKLLRFLETGEYRCVGSDRIQHADLWILAATNRNLQKEIELGNFREDLLYRLNIMHLKLPALRLREGDIELLANHFLRKLGRDNQRFSECAFRAMFHYEWPGNVRELKHRIERAIYMSQTDEITASDLELEILATQHNNSDNIKDERNITLSKLWQLIERDGLSLAEATAYCEKLLIQSALKAENNNRTRAAERLGIHVRTIFKKLAH